MDLPVTTTGQSFMITEAHSDGFKTDLGVMPHSEVVYFPTAAIEDDRQRCSCEFEQTSPSGVELFPFLRT